MYGRTGAASDGATRLSVKIFQLGNVGGSEKRVPSELIIVKTVQRKAAYRRKKDF